MVWKKSEDFEIVLTYWERRCAYCLIQLEKNRLITRDHFIPRCKRGSDTIFNIVPSCHACNQDKGGQHPNKWCSEAQRDHIIRYLNWLMHRYVVLHKTTGFPGYLLMKKYQKYMVIRRRVKSNVRITITPRYI